MMRGNYKLLLLDLDGTTVASKENAMPNQKVIDAVKKAQNKVHVALATGRPFQFAKPITESLGLHGPSVFNGGAEIIDLSTKKIVHRQVLDIETLRELVKLAVPFGFSVYTDYDQYNTKIMSPDQINNEAAKLFIEAVETKSLAALLEELGAVAGAAAHPTSSWHDGDVVDIHITHEHGTKRYGVERLIKYLDVTKETVLAIGDGHNDIPLLEAAGTKVAMGNAPDEVKAVADYVAPSLQEDGVAVAIERYIFS